VHPNQWSDLNFYSGIFVGVIGSASLILVCGMIGSAAEFLFRVLSRKKRL